MSKSKQQAIAVLSILLLFTLILTACTVVEASDEEIEELWQTSAHADTESRAFTRWDDDPPEIPERCAKCHSAYGYRDFLGLDGSSPGQVDQPVPVGSTIECDACHNEVAQDKSRVGMPSGLEITGLTQEANCMECHQGRASGVQVHDDVGGLPADSMNTNLSLPNIHNTPAGPTQYGTEAKGGFEYDGLAYLERYEHVIQYETCHACHDAHTLQIKIEQCSACHRDAITIESLADIRTGNIDYDGDGDVLEGLAGEIETMQERLLVAMRVYAVRTESVDNIEYDDRFVDDAGKHYTTWTPRLLQAAYNYEYTVVDPGGYAHNGRYIIQLLYDTLNDLGADVFGMIRPE